jgi:hypothetical protein
MSHSAEAGPGRGPVGSFRIAGRWGRSPDYFRPSAGKLMPIAYRRLGAAKLLAKRGGNRAQIAPVPGVVNADWVVLRPLRWSGWLQGAVHGN